VAFKSVDELEAAITDYLGRTPGRAAAPSGIGGTLTPFFIAAVISCSHAARRASGAFFSLSYRPLVASHSVEFVLRSAHRVSRKGSIAGLLFWLGGPTNAPRDVLGRSNRLR
jgi:hypothetical protein